MRGLEFEIYKPGLEVSGDGESVPSHDGDVLLLAEESADQLLLGGAGHLQQGLNEAAASAVHTELGEVPHHLSDHGVEQSRGQDRDQLLHNVGRHCASHHSEGTDVALQERLQNSPIKGVS